MATDVNRTEITLEKSAAHHLEDTLGVGAVLEAKQATDEEHEQTLWQALKANRKAVTWSVLISMTIIMEGYDTILMGNFFAYPTFQQKYGQYYGEKIGWQVSAPWQTGLNMGSTIGAIFGELLDLTEPVVVID
jgi:SP family general alpha glucoside:H+ symporter-like MFS transporter